MKRRVSDVGCFQRVLMRSRMPEGLRRGSSPRLGRRDQVLNSASVVASLRAE